MRGNSNRICQDMQVNLSHITDKKNQKKSATHLFWSRLETLLSKKQKYVFDQTQEGPKV